LPDWEFEKYDTSVSSQRLIFILFNSGAAGKTLSITIFTQAQSRIEISLNFGYEAPFGKSGASASLCFHVEQSLSFEVCDLQINNWVPVGG
jgi:hypothetical protein